MPLIIFEIPLIREKLKTNRLALIIGSLFPDIIDKTILLLKFGAGRGIAHTLLFNFITFLFVFFLSKGNTAVTLSFLSGLILHLILDIPYVPWFYPFISYDFPIHEDPVGNWIMTLFTDSIVITTEIIGFIILLGIFIKYKLWSKTYIIDFLKTNPKIQNNNNSK